MAIQAFISCRFPPNETIKNICEMLQPEISPYVSQDVKLGNLPQRLKEKIGTADCLLAVLTEQGSSAFIQNEVGIAFALNKPIFAIYEETVDVSGIQPYLSTFIKYKKDKLSDIAKDIHSLKVTASTEISSREIAGAPEEILGNLSKNGVQGIYSDRATAFRVFNRIWQREQNIRIVGSTIEGFKRGIGIEARELILPKVSQNKESTVHILLTHASFAKLREGPEKEQPGYITRQIKTTTQMLQEIKKDKNVGERLKWKYFKGAPTCFMILAGNFMLLNPYLYMQAAYFNFTMIVKDTNSPFDIYNHYSQYHFQKAWDDPELSTEEAGFDLLQNETKGS
ncbi:MAG: hypothetical protein HY934_04130 [Candidatus Firestonebacteria bacterium]|nr:hypothetical protein [Candidatus Firestonebacteria bacterium]